MATISWNVVDLNNYKLTYKGINWIEYAAENRGKNCAFTQTRNNSLKYMKQVLRGPYAIGWGGVQWSSELLHGTNLHSNSKQLRLSSPKDTKMPLGVGMGVPGFFYTLR